MLVFKRNTREGQPVPGQITLVVGNSFVVKLVGLGPDKKHYVIKSDSPCVEVQQKADDRFQEQAIRFKANMACQGARITVYEKTSGDRTPLELKINVLEPLVLPPENTDEGLLARLLLSEVVQPSAPGYPGAEETFLSMQLMRQVLENRMSFPKFSIFSNPSSRSMLAIITAGGGNEFDGFGAYPRLSSEKIGSFNVTLRNANDGSHMKFEAYRQHVKNILDVANGRVPKIPGRNYGWRTVGAGPAGGSYVPGPIVGGQQFNTLRDDVLKENGIK
ncbi:hypothetical protein [Pseudomonas mangiferae]|uniref:Uncharacterized protein n=1 Tax=Pseudomonas mangiferae TaxID=2593654 RepID=A0A553GVZ9_9PSED|nr:hypothetical protein [Pseudomonas mangiferae]TRX73681.1 hypothetical protein FM069_16235 [Pseudomonas mangiferae]